MTISIFDLFKIGIGPSSSHTVGPMKAAALFARRLNESGLLPRTTRVEARLYGSLGATGKGHGTDKAVVLGLLGVQPDTVDPDAVPALLKRVSDSRHVRLDGVLEVPFNERTDVVFLRRESLPFHPNGVRFSAFAADGALLEERRYFSVGGGFVVSQEEADAPAGQARIVEDPTVLPHPFSSGDQLLAATRATGLSIAALVRANERAWRSDAEIDAGIDRLWDAMKACVERGCRTEGHLPGGMKVRRRAPELFRSLTQRPEQAWVARPGDRVRPPSAEEVSQARGGPALGSDPLTIIDWVNLYAMAVNEENAAGGRVVTAPTNGAAGIVPAVLHYYDRVVPGAGVQGVRDFILTAGAIGMLYKENASISCAEVGCQGEVGVACSMAAGALCAVMGGTPEQVENAAEIGMEHNLGLTCDPVGGMVQIPCIERNAMGSVKALNAARMALRGDGTHYVSLDKVIKTMRDTGRDMMTKYKETSRGGLAVNVIEC